jgi:hypothetical protein
VVDNPLETSEEIEEAEETETHQATGVLQEEDEISEAGSDVAVRRRSTRIRKKRNALTIDFNNRAFAQKNGVVHINTNVQEQAREDRKITLADISPAKQIENVSNPGRLNVRTVPPRNISRHDLRRGYHWLEWAFQNQSWHLASTWSKTMW